MTLRIARLLGGAPARARTHFSTKLCLEEYLYSPGAPWPPLPRVDKRRRRDGNFVHWVTISSCFFALLVGWCLVCSLHGRVAAAAAAVEFYVVNNLLDDGCSRALSDGARARTHRHAELKFNV